MCDLTHCDELWDIESLLLRWAVLEQIQWDSWAGQEQSRQLDERCCSLQCITNIKTIEKLRLKNGILLTMNQTEHTGWIIVDVGRMTQATISVVTIARAVAPFPKRMNAKHALPTSGSTDSKFSELTSGSISKRAPGSTICAHTNNNTTQTVIRMNWPFKTNLSCFSAKNEVILTEISTTLVLQELCQRRWRGFSWWGGWRGRSWRGRRSWGSRRPRRAGKEATSLQPSSKIFGSIFDFNQGTELVFAGFLTLVIL